MRITLNDLLAGNDPGTVSFQLKPTKKRGETYPLKLTKHQRETLLEHVQMAGKLKKRIQEPGHGTQIINVTRKELDQLNDGIGITSPEARSPHKKKAALLGSSAGS